MSAHRLGWEQIWSARELDPIARHHAGPPEPDVIRFAGQLREENRRRVLDLGCGVGRHTAFLAGAGLDAVGVDVSPTAVAATAASLAEVKAGAALQAEMSRLPLRDGVLDAAVAWNVVYHARLEAIERTLAEVRRVLAPGGLFLLTLNSTENDSAIRARDAVATGGARELEPETYVMLGDPGDKGLPHHYTTERELRERLLKDYSILSLEQRRASDLRDGRPHRVARFVVLARKE